MLVGRLRPLVWSRRSGEPRPPAEAILVDRTTPWGNPFSSGSRYDDLLNYKKYIIDAVSRNPSWIYPLVGKDLICWCVSECRRQNYSLSCHAQILRNIVHAFSTRYTVGDIESRGGYQVLYLDPPWLYNNRVTRSAASGEYVTASVEDLAQLPINRIASQHSVMFCWATYPCLTEALRLIALWGFTYKTCAFVWVKYRGRKLTSEMMRRNASELAELADTADVATLRELNVTPMIGLGNWTRANTELCLLATKGKPTRHNAGISQIIETQDEQVVEATLQAHSAKPAIVRDKINQLLGLEANKIEIFARVYPHSQGFDCYGNEICSDVMLTEADMGNRLSNLRLL